MNFGACIRCKKNIKYDDINLCDECRTYYFKSIRAYLEENKNCNNIELARNLNIPLKVVNYFIKNGDLVDIASRYSETREDKINTIKELGEVLKKDLKNKKNIYSGAKMQYMKKKR